MSSSREGVDAFLALCTPSPCFFRLVYMKSEILCIVQAMETKWGCAYSWKRINPFPAIWHSSLTTNCSEAGATDVQRPLIILQPGRWPFYSLHPILFLVDALEHYIRCLLCCALSRNAVELSTKGQPLYCYSNGLVSDCFTFMHHVCEWVRRDVHRGSLSCVRTAWNALTSLHTKREPL